MGIDFKVGAVAAEGNAVAAFRCCKIAPFDAGADGDGDDATPFLLPRWDLVNTAAPTAAGGAAGAAHVPFVRFDPSGRFVVAHAQFPPSAASDGDGAEQAKKRAKLEEDNVMALFG